MSESLLHGVSEVWPVALKDGNDPALSAIMPSKRPAVRLLHIGRVSARLKRLEAEGRDPLLAEDLAGALAVLSSYHALLEKAGAENRQLQARIKKLEAALAGLN